MSKYLLNKFLYTVDRDPELVERYREDPRGHGRVVGGRARERAPQLPRRPSASTWLAFDDAEREALRTHDYVRAVRAGRAPVPHADAVHRDVRAGPRRAARLPARSTPEKLAHFSLPYTDIAT